MSSLLGNVGSLSTVLLVVSVFIFCSGLFFVAASARIDQKAITRRTDLATPTLPLAGTDAPKRKGRLALFHEPGSDAAEVQHSSIAWTLERFRISTSRVSLVFAAGRFIAAVGVGLLVMFVIDRVPALAGITMVSPVAAVVATVAGWFLPPALIRMSVRRRARAVAGALPEALDLLVVCVDAGLSLEDALGRVVKELGRTQPELAEELALTSADLQILPSCDEALQRMADRIDLPNARAFVSTLIQTLRYGTPLAQSLRTISAEMRNDALIKLEERANKLPALLTVPMMLLIMPTIFLIIGGPAALRVIDLWR